MTVIKTLIQRITGNQADLESARFDRTSGRKPHTDCR